MAKSIVVVGSINTDFVLHAPRLPAAGETVTDARFQVCAGGKGANQAVAAARLGVPTRFIGKIGNDTFGARLRSGLRAAGVNVTNLLTARDAPSGTAFVIADARGQNAIVVSPGANRRLTLPEVQRCRRQLASAGVILVQLEIPLGVVAYVVLTAARAGVPLILDAAPARPLPQRLLRKVAILTANETEAAVLCGARPGRLAPTESGLTRRQAEAICRRMLGLGPAAVILKLGDRGALLAERPYGRPSGRGGRLVHIPAMRVRAVDSTAAGDAFNAALAVGLLEAKSLVEAARFGACVAGYSVTRPGAQPSLPTRAELNRWLRSRGVRISS